MDADAIHRFDSRAGSNIAVPDLEKLLDFRNLPLVGQKQDDVVPGLDHGVRMNKNQPAAAKNTPYCRSLR